MTLVSNISMQAVGRPSEADKTYFAGRVQELQGALNTGAKEKTTGMVKEISISVALAMAILGASAGISAGLKKIGDKWVDGPLQKEVCVDKTSGAKLETK